MGLLQQDPPSVNSVPSVVNPRLSFACRMLREACCRRSAAQKRASPSGWPFFALLFGGAGGRLSHFLMTFLIRALALDVPWISSSIVHTFRHSCGSLPVQFFGRDSNSVILRVEYHGALSSLLLFTSANSCYTNCLWCPDRRQARPGRPATSSAMPRLFVW